MANLTFVDIFSKDDDKVHELISLIKEFFSKYTDSTSYTYILYLYNFTKELINRIPEKPHHHFSSVLFMHVKNLRKKANKFRLNRQLENKSSLDKETADLLDKDFVRNVKPHINNHNKDLFTADFNRYRIYGSLMLRMSCLTGIRASALSNFKTEELLKAKMDKNKLYNIMVKDHKTSEVYGSQPVPLPRYLVDTLKNMINKKESNYVFSKIENGGQLSVPDIDGIITEYQRYLNAPSIITLVMVRRFFTDYGYSSGWVHQTWNS